MKTILITGSTDGIGKLTAIKLAKEDHTIYVHGRNEAKLNAVISEIKEASKTENIEGFVADFSDLDAVSKMANEIKNKVAKIDVLINNAGIFKTAVTTGYKGFDIRFVVNYLAPYLLTNELLPLLKNAGNSRLINLSSAAQSPVSDLILEGGTINDANSAYAQSKLALTMWSFAFAKANPEIITIAVNPGSLLNTKMANEAYGQHWSPAKKGVDILYDLAMSEAHQNDSGKYFDNDKGMFNHAHPDAYKQEKIDTLISETNKIV